MTKLYNVQTGLAEVLPLEQIPSAIQSGTHAYKKGTKLTVKDQNDTAFDVDASELPIVFEEGYRLESPEEGAVREYVKENKGVKGAVKVFGRELLNNATLGVSENILKNTSDPLEVAKYEALKDDNTIANVGGNVAGFASSLFTGAPIFKAGAAAGKAVVNKVSGIVGEKVGEEAAKGILRRAGEKAVEYGVDGIVTTLPTAISEATLGDPTKAAEYIVSGGALGGVLGGTLGALKPLAKLGKEKIEYMTGQKKLETDAAYRLIGATPAVRAKVPSDVEQMLPKYLKDITADDVNILKSPDKLLNRINEVSKSSGEKLDEVVKTLDDRLKLEAQTNPQLAIELKDKMFDYTKLINDIEEKYVKQYQNTPGYGAQVKSIQDYLDQIKNKVNVEFGGDPKPIDLINLRQFKKDNAKLAKFDRKSLKADLFTDAKQDIDTMIQDYFKNDIGANIKDVFPDLAGVANQFKPANDAYRVSSEISKIVKGSAAKADTKSAVTFGDLVLGGIGYGAGDLTGAATILAAKKASSVLNKSFDVAGLLQAEQIMKRTAKALDAIPKRLSEIEKPLRAVAARKLSDFTDNEDSNDFKKLSRSITDASANPAALTSFYEQTLDVMGDQGAPQIAENAKQQTMEAISYLNNLLPKPLTIQNPLVKNKEYEPSAMEKNRFMRQARAALDPLSIVDGVADGSVTKEELQVVADLYPDIFQRIQEKVFDAVEKNPNQIPYNKRLKLSLLLNMDLDPSLSPEILPFLVNTQPEASQEPGKVPSNNVNFTTYPTETQRLAMK